MLMQQPPSFKEAQLKHSRVKSAYQEKEGIVKKYFSDKNLSYSKYKIFLRGFKKEKELQVWVKGEREEKFTLLTRYDFCSTSGVLGPKRREGDLQIPEGIYELNHFNPLSNFYLSLGVSYPNASDRKLSDKSQPGGAIYIHGNCVTIGCIPITDDKIKELYVLAVEARNNGQGKIPIHIFPSKLTDDGINQLKRFYPDPQLVKFWENLKPIFDDFENTNTLKEVKVNSKGEYYF
jgi:murein L,D-transpeptidase YafK